jgi:hypothetical protein
MDIHGLSPYQVPFPLCLDPLLSLDPPLLMDLRHIYIPHRIRYVLWVYLAAILDQARHGPIILSFSILCVEQPCTVG